MALDFERFQQAARDLHPDARVYTSLCKIEADIAAFEAKVGTAKSERAAYDYVMGDTTPHPFWFHAWQRVRRATEAAFSIEGATP